MGSRYGQLPQPTGLENMPPPARIAVTASLHLFQSTDRGMVRNSNDRTMDNRVARFRDWLATACGYHHLCCAQQINASQAILLVGTYLDHIAALPIDRKGNLPKANTLAHHANAASIFLKSVMTEPFSIYMPGGGKSSMIPYISARIDLRRKWEQPREKREPYTYDMFQAFAKQVSTQEKTDPHAFLGKLSLVFNTQCLGIFTGSRISEYAQSKGPVNSVSRVPLQPGQSLAQALPVAFVAQDFTFLDADGKIISHCDLFKQPKRATTLHIRFRHDKSGRNYCIRKYGRGTKWLCPIAAATRLLYRAHLLGIDATDPICAYRQAGATTYRYLRDTDVTDTMRRMCVAAYPDPDHYLRKHIHCFASHSNRVTAAVALSQTNMSIDDIAQRLRWKPESVAYYLRESARDIGAYTANAIIGAQRAFQ
jgi:hypothetical protein